jgi:hypothetical protein
VKQVKIVESEDQRIDNISEEESSSCRRTVNKNREADPLSDRLSHRQSQIGNFLCPQPDSATTGVPKKCSHSYVNIHSIEGKWQLNGSLGILGLVSERKSSGFEGKQVQVQGQQLTPVAAF